MKNASVMIQRFCLAALLLLAALSVWRGIHNALLEGGSKDNQWRPSRDLLEHTDPYTLLIEAEGQDVPLFLSQAPNYPASGLILLWPYAVWEWPVARALWAVSNLAFTAIILGCLFALMGTSTSVPIKILTATLFVMSTPWRNGVGNGQHALFALAGFLLAVHLWRRKQTTASACCTAIAWFKYTIAFPLCLLFTREKRGWHILLGAGLIHVGLTLFLALWTQTSVMALLLEPLRVAQVATKQGLVDVFAIFEQVGHRSFLMAGPIGLAILAISYVATLRDRDTLSCLSLLAVTSLGITYHLIYDFAILVIPLAYALRERGKSLRAIYYLALIGVIWFVDRGMDALLGRGMLGSLEAWEAPRFWIRSVLFHGVLAADWINAFSQRRPFDANTPQARIS